jgi:hypothetical protein
MDHLLRAHALGLAVVLAGCTSVPLPSLVRLIRINAETTDLAALRVAVRLPDALKPRPGGVNMDVLVKVSGAPDQKTTLFLIETHDVADLSGLSGAVRSGFSIYAYRLAPSDIERLVLMRAALLKQRQGGKGGSLGVGIATKEFCLVGPLPSGPLLSTTYLLTSETRSYVVVSNDLDLSKEPAVAAELPRLKPC